MSCLISVDCAWTGADYRLTHQLLSRNSFWVTIAIWLRYSIPSLFTRKWSMLLMTCWLIRRTCQSSGNSLFCGAPLQFLSVIFISFYNKLFEDHFHMCLEFPAQNRFIVVFPLICGHFQNCTHELCPEEVVSSSFYLTLWLLWFLIAPPHQGTQPICRERVPWRNGKRSQKYHQHHLRRTVQP